MNLFKFVAIFCASELIIVFAYPVTNDEPSRPNNSPADEQSVVKNSQPETGEPSTMAPEKKSWADWADETSSSDPDEPAGGKPSLNIDEPRGKAPPLKTVEHTTFKQASQRQAQKTPTPWKASTPPPPKTSDGILGTSPRKMVVLGTVRSKETHFPRSRLERITSATVNDSEDQNSDASNNLNVAPRMMSWVSFKGVNAPENSPVEQVREHETRQSSSSPPSTHKMSWADIAKGKSLDESSPKTPSTSPNTTAAMERQYSEAVTSNITQVPDRRDTETLQLDTVQKTIHSPAPAEVLSLRPHTEPTQRNIQSRIPDNQMLSRGPSTEIVQENTQTTKPIEPEKFAAASVMDFNKEVPSLTEKAPALKAKESEKVEQNIDEPTTSLEEKVPVVEAKESEKIEQNIDVPETSVKEVKESDKVQQNTDDPATKSPQKLSWADWAEMEGSDSDMDELERNLMSFSQTAEPTIPEAKPENILTKSAREPPKIKWSAAPPPTLGPRPSWADLTRGRSLERTVPSTSTTEQQYPDVTRSDVRRPSNRPRGSVAPHQYGTQVNIPPPMATGRVPQPFERIINEQSERPAQHVGQREIQQGSGRPSTAVPPNSSIPWARIVSPNFYPVQPPATVPHQGPADQAPPQPEMENRRTIDDSGTSTIKKLLGIGTTAEAENSVTQSTGQQATTPVSSPMANRSVGDQTADSMVSTTPSKKSAYVPPFKRAVKDGSSSAENSPMKRPGEQGKMMWDSHSPPTTTRTEETKVDTVKDMSFETEKSDELKVDQQLSETIELPVEESGPIEQNIAPEGTQPKTGSAEITPIEKLARADITETKSSPSETAEPNIEQPSQPEGTDLQKDMQSEVDESPASPEIPFSEDAEPISQQAETIPSEQTANRSVAVPDMPSPENAEPELQHTEAKPEQNEQDKNQRNDAGRFITIGGFKLFLVEDDEEDEEESSVLDNVEPPIVETISEAAEKVTNSVEDKPKESSNTDRLPTATSESSEPMQTDVTNLNSDSSQPTPSETPKTNIQPTTPPTSLQTGDFELGSHPSTTRIDGDELATQHTGQQLPPPVSSIPTTPQSSPSQIEAAEQMIQKSSSPKVESDADRISKSVPFKIEESTQPSPASPVTPTTPVTPVTPATPAKAKASPLASNANFHGAKIVPPKTFRDIVTGHTEEPQRISRTLRKRNKRKHKRKEKKLLTPETPQEHSSQENSDEYLSAPEGVDSPLTPTSSPEAEDRMTDSRAETPKLEDTDTLIDSKTEVPEPVQENKDSMANLETETPPAPLQEGIEDSVPDTKMELPASIKDDDDRVIVSKTETPVSSQVDKENVGPTDSKTGETEEVAKPPDPPPDILVNFPDSKLALKCPSKEIVDDLERCLSEFKKFYDESTKTETQVVVLRNIPADINERKLNFKVIGTYGEKPAEVQMVDVGKAKYALIRVGDILLEKIKNSPVLQFLQNRCTIDYCPVIELEDEDTQSEPDEKTQAEKDSQSRGNSKAQKSIQPPKKPQPSEKTPYPSLFELSEESPPDSPSESSPTKSARRKMRAKRKKEALAELFAHARFGVSASSSETKAEGSSSNTGKEKTKTPTPQPSKISQPRETIQSRTSVKLKETPQPQVSSSSQNIRRAWSQPIPQPAEKSLPQKSPTEEVSRSLDARKPQQRLPASPLGISQSANESRQQQNLKNGETSQVQHRLKSPEKVQSAWQFEKKVFQNSQKHEQGPHQTPDESKLPKIPQPEKILTHPNIQFGNLNLQPEGIHPALEVPTEETQISETIQEPTEEVETPQSAKSSQPDSSEEALTPVKMSRTALKRMRQRKKKEEFEELLSEIRYSDSKLVSKVMEEPDLNADGEEAEVPQGRDWESSTDKVGEAPPSQNVEMLGQDERSPLDRHELTIGKHKLLFRSNKEGDDVTTILEADILVQLPDTKLFLKCPSKEVAVDLQNCIAEFQKLYNESAKSSAHVLIIRDIASDLNDRKLKFKIMEKYKEKPDEVKIVSSSASQKKYALIQVSEALLEKMENSPDLQFLQNQYTIENYPVVDRTEELASDAQPDESAGTSTPDSDPSPAEPEPRENKETRKVGQRKKKKENILAGAPSAQDPLPNEAAVRRWKAETANWDSIGQMLDENDGEGLSRSDRLIVLPKNPADDVFAELQNFIPYPRKYGVTVKRTVLFASNVAFVDCGSDAEALVLGEALKKSEKLLAYPATIFINEVWLHALPLDITLDDIARSFRQKYGRGPLNIQFVAYKTKPKERLARITVNETLLRDVRADPSINIEWINGELRRPIQVQHCANCWLFGHRTEKCRLPTLPANMRI